jgi:DNA-binding transcriptional LysR family regulator
MLDIKLDTLLTVYEENSFTKASQKLNLTQPAISNHIHLLEQEIGHPLCIRTNKGISFTPQGEIVVNCAKELKTTYKNMCEEIDYRRKTPEQLSIGIIRSMENNHAIINAVSKYIKLFPKTCVSLHSDHLSILMDMLENYELDLILTYEPPEPTSFVSRALGMDRFVCLVGSANPLSAKSIITLEELKQEPLITWPSSSLNRILLEKALTHIGDSILNFNIVLETNSNTTIKMLARKDVGVAIVPQSIFSFDSMYRGIMIENLDIVQEIHLILRKDFSHFTIIDDFAECF